MKTINFNEAMQELMCGNRVKAVDWADHEFIYYMISDDSIHHRSVFDNYGDEVTACTLLANYDSEWEVLDFKMKYKNLCDSSKRNAIDDFLEENPKTHRDKADWILFNSDTDYLCNGDKA